MTIPAGRKGLPASVTISDQSFTAICGAGWIADADQPAVQDMSWPQQSGDLILPCPFGHSDICTLAPLSRVSVPLTRGASHLPQVALTLIPHFSHS